MNICKPEFCGIYLEITKCSNVQYEYCHAKELPNCTSINDILTCAAGEMAIVIKTNQGSTNLDDSVELDVNISLGFNINLDSLDL
jgi:hypothetical protein